MIAYHFPPLRGSSGIHRVLAFGRYLSEDHGWKPTVLTLHPRAYPETSDDLVRDIAPGIEVVRAFGLDTARHLSIAGRYPLRLALPDRWISWWIGGTLTGGRLIRRQRPDVLWSTYPIATAQAIAHTLHRRSGIPWVADFRDPMTEATHPSLRPLWESRRKIENRVVQRCAKVVFTTKGTAEMYAQRYPMLPRDRWAVIENGYNEDAFLDAERERSRAPRREIVLLHSGVIYTVSRDPRPFFAAVRRLRSSGAIRPGEVRIVLRASGDEADFGRLLREYGIDDVVFLEEAIPYRRALAEMMDVDGLLLFQSPDSNHQVPAKVYEYIRARRPILALTDPASDTADVLRGAGVGTVARIDSEEEIVAALPRFLDTIRAGTFRPAPEEAIERHSRRARARELARILDQVCESRVG